MKDFEIMILYLKTFWFVTVVSQSHQTFVSCHTHQCIKLLTSKSWPLLPSMEVYWYNLCYLFAN